MPGYPDATRVARTTGLVARRGASRSWLRAPVNDFPAVAGLLGFDPPVHLLEIIVSAMSHLRLDADPAHRWLRSAGLAFFTGDV